MKHYNHGIITDARCCFAGAHGGAVMATDNKPSARGSSCDAQLRIARTAIDRLTVERARLTYRNAQLEQENEALRDMTALLARSVGGAVL